MDQSREDILLYAAQKAAKKARETAADPNSEFNIPMTGQKHSKEFPGSWGLECKTRRRLKKVKKS